MKFERAVRQQEAAGKVTREERAVLVAAIYSDREVKNGRTYAEQLFFEVTQIAGGFFDDVQDFLRMAVQWLVENWETVLRVALTILIMLI
jgi:hypothetical protein